MDSCIYKEEPQQIDAVLPLTLRDYERFEILQTSLETFATRLVKELWIVVPDKEFLEIKSRINGKKYLVIPESSLIPEFGFFKNARGWMKQQLIKLAIAERIQTDFYLTLDADVICVKSVEFSDLIRHGRAVCYTQHNNKFPQWHEGSAKILQLQKSALYHNVTPTVLSREAVIKLQEYLTGLYLSQLKKGYYPVNLLARKIGAIPFTKFFSKVVPGKVLQRIAPPNWKTYLLMDLVWTEYSLYYSFLEAMEMFETYHVLTEHCIYSVKNSVWLPNHYHSFDATDCFTGERNFFFIVIQSTTNINPTEIWNKAGEYLNLTVS